MQQASALRLVRNGWALALASRSINNPAVIRTPRVLRDNEQLVETEGQEWIGEFAEEPLEQCGKLHGIIRGEIDGRRVPVDNLNKLVQALNVTVLAKYAFNGHI